MSGNLKMVESTTVDPSKEKLSQGKTVLVFGANGMVGSRFCEQFGGPNFLSPLNTELDLTNKSAVKAYIEKHKPDIVINFAAFTNVNEAEKQKGDKEGTCWKINVEGMQNIVDAIDPEKTHFIQISTDMVFSGSAGDPGPYDEDHLAETDPDKLTWYGHTKAEAERRILEKLGDKATIVRIIYPVTDHYALKLDYLRTPLAKYLKEGKLPYPLFNDQQVNITDVDDVAKALKIIVENKYYGVLHVASPDFSNPHQIISGFLSLVTGKEIYLDNKPLDEGNRRYPKFGGLKTETTRKRLGISFKEIDKIEQKLVDQGVDKKLLQ